MRTAKEIQKKLGLKHQPDIYQNRENAFSSLKHYVKLHIVMLGTDLQYWVVCPADAQRLYKQGFEYAE